MKRILIFLVSLFAVALVASILVPSILLKRGLSLAEENCASCEISIGWARMSLLNPGEIIFHNIKFKAGVKGVSEFSATVPMLAIDFRLMPLLSHQIAIAGIEVVDPDLVFVDGDGKTATQNNAQQLEWPLEAEKTRVYNGRFTYIRNTHGTSATLHIHSIDANVGQIGTTEIAENRILKGHANARIEKSGSLDLEVGTAPFATPMTIEVTLKAKDQNLADLTPFFKENAGVELKGVLLDGKGHVQVTGRNLIASVWAEYQGLDVKLIKMYDRSETAAFFTNLGAAIAMREKNKGSSKEDQTRQTKMARKSDQSIVSFILQGLKAAALNVSMPSITK